MYSSFKIRPSGSQRGPVRGVPPRGSRPGGPGGGPARSAGFFQRLAATKKGNCCATLLKYVRLVYV